MVQRLPHCENGKTGELLPARKTKAGTYYYSTADLLGLKSSDAPTICYARVSSPDQKADLDRQIEIVIIHQGVPPSFEEQLVQDVL